MVHSAGRSIERMEREWPELGQAIRQRRRKLGLSQEELAGKVGTALSYMSEIETAKVSPSVAVLRRIADALGMKTSELVADAESLD
ncbi:MAG: helix-turn-helix transcriptional regulator [Planctomycetales bacterium]|nr:helix-turn-helix transcriptional regulator [Planctomycetales bacterium]